MWGIVIVVWSLIGMFLIRHHMKKSNLTDQKKSTLFWNQEKASLVVRKKEIEPDAFIIPQIHPAQFIPSEFYTSHNLDDLNERQNYLAKLISTKMVDFSHINNAELRLKYGTATMTDIETYEDNYNNYIHCLYLIGKGLHSIEENTKALPFLEEGIRVKTEIRDHYLILADIYVKENKNEALNRLIESAEELHSLTKHALVRDLKAKLHRP